MNPPTSGEDMTRKKINGKINTTLTEQRNMTQSSPYCSISWTVFQEL